MTIQTWNSPKSPWKRNQTLRINNSSGNTTIAICGTTRIIGSQKPIFETPSTGSGTKPPWTAMDTLHYLREQGPSDLGPSGHDRNSHRHIDLLWNNSKETPWLSERHDWIEPEPSIGDSTDPNRLKPLVDPRTLGSRTHMENMSVTIRSENPHLEPRNLRELNGWTRGKTPSDH